MKVILNRQLVGVEDLLLGTGTAEQTRGGQQVQITKLDLTTIPWNPITGQTIAEYIQQEVDVAQQAIIYVNVEAVDGLQANAVYDIPNNTITFTIPRGILSFSKTSGTGAPGTVDTYTLTLSDNATFDIQVYNGVDGTGTGDMLKSTYDTTNNGKVDIAEVAESVEWDAIQNKPILLQIDDETASLSAVYSSLKTQDLHDIQAQSIANLATSQGEFSGTGSPSILVLTTTEQLLPFDVTISSTNTNMFDFDDTNNRVTFKVDASYNFRTSLSLLLGTDSTRIVTVTGRNYTDDSVVYQRVVTINGTTNDIIPIDSNQLLTVGKNGIPSAPLTIYFTFKVDATGVTLRDLSSTLTSSSSYNVSTEASGISVTPVGGISSTNVQNALAELDTEKASNSSLRNRNYIINGNFDIWDYATSQTSNGYGSDNRWNNLNTGTTKTHSLVACTDVERALFNASNFSRTVVSSVELSTNRCVKAQFVEDITKLAGKTVTLSFWARADSNKNIAVEFYQFFGLGGSPSTSVSISPQLVSLSTSWQKKIITVAIPSIVGKTLGTEGVHTTRTDIWFWFDAGSANNERSASLGQQSGTFDIAQVQLEEGSVATPFENRDISIEELLCSRYLIKIGGKIDAQNVLTFCNITTTISRCCLLISMRSAPTLSYYGTLSNYSIGGSTLAAILIIQSSGSHVSIDATGTYTAGQAYPIRFATTSEYFLLSAEL